MSSTKSFQENLNTAIRTAADSFQGTLDTADSKNYFLSFLFFKYISDTWSDQYEELQRQIGKKDDAIREKLANARFIMPRNCTFEYLRKHKNDGDLGELVNKTVLKIEEANPLILAGIFREADFSSSRLGELSERNARIKRLIDVFAKAKFNFRPSLTGTDNSAGAAFRHLLERYAQAAGKKSGEYYTPKEISLLLGRLLTPKPGDTIADPACGSGSLLVAMNEACDGKAALYGQEIHAPTWAQARMNLLLQGFDGKEIRKGNVLSQPQHLDDEGLMKFDIVVSNPPFSYEAWDPVNAADDPFNRFAPGIPPKNKGNFAFVLHMIASAKEETGKAGVIVPHGLLFRDGTESQIRENLVRDNLLEAVIGLPANLFFGTGIPAAILLFNKGKQTKDVLFIDASQGFESSKKQNRIRSQHAAVIENTFQSFLAGGGQVPGYSRRVRAEEIERQGFNLSIARYIDTSRKEKRVDLAAVQRRMEELERELNKAKSEMNRYLRELDFNL